jgi:triacylglycerol lipase
MSTFVELDPREYDGAAFEHFNPTAPGFEIVNARALMWFSQLAYETHRAPTIKAVSEDWEFTSVVPFMKHKTSLKGSFETCGLIGERAGAVILAFAGTDPGVWQNLATDVELKPQEGSDIHSGFQIAAAAAQPEIEQAFQLSRQLDKPLFITGHSLGAALAALAAQTDAGQGSQPQAVYTFGMPRVGGDRFRASYVSISSPVWRRHSPVSAISAACSRVKREQDLTPTSHCRRWAPMTPHLTNSSATSSKAGSVPFCQEISCRGLGLVPSVLCFDLSHPKSGTIYRTPTGKH